MSVSALPRPVPSQPEDVEPSSRPLSRRLGLVAAEPGEGLAGAVLAYAREEAGRGARVAVVEADGAWPCLARLCNVPSRPGLSEVLAGSAALRDAVHSGADGIACLPFGEARSPVSPHPDEPGLAALLDLMARRYDRVLVACPALSEPEAVSILAAGLDGFVVVVGAERTRRRAVEGTVRALEQAGAAVVGTILRDCRRPLPEWIERWLP